MPILSALNLYPIKACAGIPLQRATVTPFGLMSEGIRDREWMLVDEAGHFLTQREYPALARIVPRLRDGMLVVEAPGMAPFAIPVAPMAADAASVVNVTIWEDSVPADECSPQAAAWFSQAIGVPCRLVRFRRQHARPASEKWTQGRAVRTLFADGFPLLAISEASLADLNQKLQAQARAPLPMNRFRPNLVIDGVTPFEEDYAATIRVGAVLLRPAKPCPRCPVPSVDQETGIPGPDPLDILQAYRANPLLDGAITFGMNVYLLEGAGQVLEVGQECEIELAF